MCSSCTFLHNKTSTECIARKVYLRITVYIPMKQRYISGDGINERGVIVSVTVFRMCEFGCGDVDFVLQIHTVCYSLQVLNCID